MAFTSVTTKVTQPWNATEIVQILSGGAGTGDLIFTGDAGLGSAHVVVTSGTDPGAASFTMKVANDGIVGVQTPPILVNPVTVVGALALTAAAPLMLDIMTGTVVGGSIVFSAAAPASQTPYKYIQFTLGGAAAANTVVTITIILVGQRQ